MNPSYPSFPIMHTGIMFQEFHVGLLRGRGLETSVEEDVQFDHWGWTALGMPPNQIV